MAPSRRVQSLIFVVREEKRDSEKEASSIKAFALLPHKLEIGLKIREVLSKNQIRILRNGDDLSPQLWQESDHVEMLEVLFDEADVMAEVLDQSKLSLVYDTCNEETIQLLFGSDFCYKTKNSDSILSVLDGSKDVLNVFERLLTIKADICFGNSRGGTLLHFALEERHFDLFELLLKRKANVSSANNDGVTPLHLAARKGYLKPAYLLLHFGAPLSAKATANLMRDSTPLHFAVIYEHLYLVKCFLQRGADVSAEDHNGTVLLQAVKTQDEDMVKTVLQYRPSVSEPGNRRALYEAVFGSSKQIVEALVNRGGFRVVAGEEDERKLMCHAVVKGCQKIVQQLLDGGVALNDGYEIPPLHLAAQFGFKDIVKLLLASGADPNLEACDKQRPLIYAIEAGQYVLNPAWAPRFMVDILVENGADITAKDSKGRRARDLRKLGAKADIHVVDFQGRTALHKAAARGNTKAIQKLIKSGGNINARCKEGKTPLMYAAEEGWIDSYSWDDATRPPSPVSVEHYSGRDSKLFAVIVNGGGYVNARCNKGRTPLAYAVGKPRFIDIRDLLDLGAYIEARDHSGKTPLHIAAENGFAVYIETLIHNGADVDARCAKGKTPLMYAAGKDHFAAVLTLLLHDARIDIVSPSDRTALDEAYEGYVAKLLETLFYYCFTDRTSLVASVERPLVSPKRPIGNYSENLGFQPSKLQEFDIVYERHVVRTKATVPLARLVRSPAFKTEGIYDYKRDVLSERELMKTLPVGDTNISFYDVLMYSSNQLASAVKNDCFMRGMETLDYKKKIPIFADIIQLKFQQACRRRKLLDCRSKIFKLLCPEFSGLPDELQERIVGFLSNSDLARLQLACSRILVFSNADANGGNKNVPPLPLCCSTKPPRALYEYNDVEPYLEPALPYWLMLTRMRL